MEVEHYDMSADCGDDQLKIFEERRMSAQWREFSRQEYFWMLGQLKEVCLLDNRVVLLPFVRLLRSDAWWGGKWTRRGYITLDWERSLVYYWVALSWICGEASRRQILAKGPVMFTLMFSSVRIKSAQYL